MNNFIFHIKPLDRWINYHKLSLLNELSVTVSGSLISSWISSHPRCSIKRGVLRNFANFTGKHLCWSLFLINFLIKFRKFKRRTFANDYFYSWVAYALYALRSFESYIIFPFQFLETNFKPSSFSYISKQGSF